MILLIEPSLILLVGSFTGGMAFYEGQRIRKITRATGYGEIINWNKGASMLTINILSGTFSSGSTVYALGDTAGNYPEVTAYITGITANPYQIYVLRTKQDPQRQ
jgi:hypothetical protein